MNIIVQKYDNSSIKNLNYISNNIIKYYKKNNSLVIVLSECKKIKNKIIKLTNKYVKYKSLREYDMLLSLGEIETVALLSMMLNEKGYKAIGLNRRTIRYNFRFKFWK